MDLLPLALSMGEPAGIGPEVCVQAWLNRVNPSIPRMYLIGDPDCFLQAAKELGKKITVSEISRASEIVNLADHHCPILPVPLAHSSQPSRPIAGNAETVLNCIRRGVQDCLHGEAAGLVTAPINKAVLADAGFPHPGHTEFVAELAGGDKPVMLLTGADLKVVPVTIHLSLQNAIKTLSTELIIETARITVSSMQRDFGIQNPHIAVAGLNPHAGENGMLGDEDENIIVPAINRLQQEGVNVSGPLPADTMFHPPARKKYDVALCMYHDQANIPVKTIAFDEGVNCTIGLPIIRTSPDHGTAFDIAGRGMASANSMIAAIKLAASIAEYRTRVD